MSRKILYIVNPISGSGVRKGLEDLFEKRAKKNAIEYLIYPSVTTGDYRHLLPIIRDNSITDVVIAGGDGTVSHVVGSLMDLDVNFGIIPCGSGNGLAYTLRIPKNSRKALDVIFNGEAKYIDGFYMNGKFACMLGGIGFDAKVAHDFAAEPKRGLVTYIRLSVRNFFSMKPYPFEIRAFALSLPVEAYFISIANSNQFGNNFKIAPQASLSDGLLDIVIVTKQSKIRFVVETLKQFAGLNTLQTSMHIKEKKGIIYFQTESVDIHNPSLAPLHIDGEPMEPSEKIHVEIKKKCFRVIHPL